MGGWVESDRYTCVRPSVTMRYRVGGCSGVAMGCAGCAVHKGPQPSEGPLRVNLNKFKIASFTKQLRVL
jgi:hypothetical protein